MGWSNDEPQVTKKGMETSSKILLAIIACLVLIIVLILILLLNIQQNTFNLLIHGKLKENYDINKLTAKIDNVTYINIEEFANLVGYEYHKGEYKAFTIEENKCYVQSKKETASFYLDESKVYKLPVDELTQEYQEHTTENPVKLVNEKLYASIDTINVAFNVSVTEKEKEINIYTLDDLISFYDKKVKEWGYTGIAEQDFENQKSLLYGYLIVNKENGLYKIIDINNTKEIVSDKYKSIEFSENTKEFFVTNSLGQVGIINLDGTTKIEPIYEAISVLDKKSDLYLVQKDQKFGVVKSGGTTIIFPEYDSIGLNLDKNTTNVENKYLILDTLIPVRKNEKWGAFNKEGTMVYKVEYDGIGCNLTTVEIDNSKKTVIPVLTIPDCEGVVVKKDEKYGALDLQGKNIIPIQVDSIYSVENEKETQYFMLYKGKELNIIEMLIEQGLLEDKNEKEETNNPNNNTIVETNNVIKVETSSNIVSNNINKSNEISNNTVK